MNNCTENVHLCCAKKVSWTPVIVGALVGIGITFLLNLFSIAIGLSAFTTKTGSMAIAIGGLIGVAIGIIAAMYTAGWVAGYLARSHCAKRNLGSLYGFVTWCLALLISMFIVSHVGNYVSSYTTFISKPTIVKESAMPTMNANLESSTDEVVITQKDMAMSAFVIFILFFLGALASCFGGHCGMCHDCRNEGCENKKCDVDQTKLPI